MTKKNVTKGIETIEDVSDFDLEALVVEGKEAVIEDEIEWYNPKTRQTERMKVYITPVSHGDWNTSIRAATKKKSKKDLEELICAKGWVEKDGMHIKLEKIRTVGHGIVSQIYQKIKVISGQTEDPFEEKYLDRLTDF